PTNEGARRLSVLPTTTPDDYQFQRGGALRPAPEITAEVLGAFEVARWVGGPYVLGLHTQVLGSDSARPAFRAVLWGLRDAGPAFLDRRTCLAWSSERSRVSTEVAVEGSSALRVAFRHLGNAPLAQAVVRLPEPAGWRVATLPPGLELASEGMNETER